MRPPTGALKRLAEVKSKDASAVSEYVQELWLLAVRLEQILEQVDPVELEGLRCCLYSSARSQGCRFPFWSAGPWTPPPVLSERYGES